MSIFVEIGVIVAIAAAFSLVMRALRQPLIIGHIIVGFVVGPYVLGIVRSPETIALFSELGIAFLLFVVGLNLSPRVIKEVGRVSVIGGFGQVLFTSLVGYFLARWMGFGVWPSWYIAAGLTFSSTIIILKLLSDKRHLETLYGKISIGFLIFQDIIAALLLILAASFNGSGEHIAIAGAMAFGKMLVLTAVIVVVARTILPKLSDFFARSQEVLFLFSLGWGLSLASLFYAWNLSLEVGALIAGVALAMTPYHHEISARLRPLRDFFLILFFIALGSQMSFAHFGQIGLPLIIFSLFVLVGNPLIVMILMGVMGYKKRTGFLTGTTVAQISEFSLILVALGVKNGHVGPEVLSLMTGVGVITIALSSYLILHAEAIYPKISRYLGLFERRKVKEKEKSKKQYEVLILGCNRIGFDFVESFKKAGKKILVVDFDPAVIKELNNKKIPCMYGDADDIEFLRTLGLQDFKMIVSTIPDFETNTLVAQEARNVNNEAIIVVVAHHITDAHTLYKGGVSYVLMPHFLGGSYATEMILHHGFSSENFRYEKTKHLAYLKGKQKRGHEHPPAEWFR